MTQAVQVEIIIKLLSGCWKRVKDIQIWLQQEHGINLKLSGIYYWLYKVNGSWKVPRPRHKGQDPEAMEQFKEEILSRLEALDIPPDRSVHVWVMNIAMG